MQFKEVELTKLSKPIHCVKTLWTEMNFHLQQGEEFPQVQTQFARVEHWNLEADLYHRHTDFQELHGKRYFSFTRPSSKLNAA